MNLVILVFDLIVAAGIAWGVNWLALIPFRRVKNSHWTERARKLYPARVGAAMSQWLIPADLALGQHLLWPQTAPPWVLTAIAAYSGSVIGSYPFSHEIFPQLGFPAWLREVLWTFTFRRAAFLLFLIFVVLMPYELDWIALTVAVAYVVVLGAYVWGGMVWLSRLGRTLSAPPDRLQVIVAGVSNRMNVSVRGVWLLRSVAAFAAVIPYTRELLFSERLLELHPDDELAAICSHELGHLKESKIILAGRVLGLLILTPLLFVKPGMRLGADSLWMIATFGTSAVILIFTRVLGRQMEIRADRLAKENEGSPGTYARALARVYEANLMPAVLPTRRRVHPDLYDRLLAAGVQPDFEKPKTASSTPWPGILLAWLLGVLIAILFIQESREEGPVTPPTMATERR